MEQTLARGQAEAGYHGAVRRAAETLAARSRVAHVPAVDLAGLCLRAGQRDQALDWLERSFETREAETPIRQSKLRRPTMVRRGLPALLLSAAGLGAQLTSLAPQSPDAPAREIPSPGAHPVVLVPPVSQSASKSEPSVRRRAGIVRLNDHVFRDDDGPYLAVGATLFWAAWGYQHDRDRLEQNLRFLARHRVDYIRVLGTVGPGGWAERTVLQDAPGYEAAIAGLTDLAYDKYGLRVEWTLIGGSSSTDTPDERSGLVEKFIVMARGREHKIQHFEVGNELGSTQAGITLPEIRELGRRLRAGTPNIVALTTPFDEAALRQLYDGSTANLLTIHLDRSQSGDGGPWRPVRQPWAVQFTWKGAWSNNEPIGPGSSVATDADPLRLAMGAAMTWLCGGASYVLHSGAGIRGQPDVHPIAGFRPANVWEVHNIEAILSGIMTVRSLLPASIPNWTRHNSNPGFAGYPFDVTRLLPILARDGLLRSFAATNEGRLVMMPLVAREPIPYTTRHAMTLTVHDPLTGAVRDEVMLRAGQTYTLPPTAAAVIVGRLSRGTG